MNESRNSETCGTIVVGVDGSAGASMPFVGQWQRRGCGQPAAGRPRLEVRLHGVSGGGYGYLDGPLESFPAAV